jgi:hypothetical protein
MPRASTQHPVPMLPDRQPLPSIDSADRAQFLKAWVFFGIPAFVVLTAIELKLLLIDKAIRFWELLVLLVVNAFITYVGARLIVNLSDRGGRLFSRMVLATDGMPHGPAFSSQESLIARGFYQEAAEQYFAHLAAFPKDAEARIRLADVCRDHLASPDSAERHYLEARRLALTPRQENTIANALIELYRKTGRRDRMKVELARFAERHRGTRPGREAERLLKEMKAEDVQDILPPA